jgi:hypothetical protein
MPIRPCPKRFKFTNPQTGEKERGTVHKQEEIEYLETEHRDYRKVVELLEWDSDGWSIRFGYYLKPHGAKNDEWTWGSQTTSIISFERIDGIMKALTNIKETYEKMRKPQSSSFFG